MFFEKDFHTFEIVEVIYLNQKTVNQFNSGRKYDAISFRYSADTLLKTAAEEIEAGPNTLWFFPAGLDYTRISKEEELVAIHLKNFTYSADRIESYMPKNPELISALFRKLTLCWQQKETGHHYRCASLLYEIFAECRAENGNDSGRDPRILNGFNYIKKNLSDPALSVAEAARRSFMSEVYFRKLFKEDLGVSPKKYIIEKRITSAKKLIATGYFSLKEVAALSGWTDYKYFSTEFKRLTGHSPSDHPKER